MLLYALLACAGPSGDTAVGQDSDASADRVAATLLSSSMTWTLEFDDEAESTGLYDCSYSRDYEGVQELGLEYLCPDCAVLTVGTATMTEGDDCFAQISSAGPVRTEQWGFSDDGRLFRTGTEQVPLGELATFEDAGEGVDHPLEWSSESELSGGGLMGLAASGSFRYVTDPDVLLDDPSSPRTEPYACGWEQNDPGDLESVYPLTDGSTFPNLHLVDQCGDRVSLWDLHGSYLIIDSTQPDCGPCQTMAEQAEGFLADVHADGLPVRIVSLLGAGLSEPWGTPSASTFEAWDERYAPSDPLLFDRGAGYALMPEYLGEDFGYPAWILVDPDMQVFDGGVGFTNWNTIDGLIRDHWESR